MVLGQKKIGVLNGEMLPDGKTDDGVSPVFCVEDRLARRFQCPPAFGVIKPGGKHRRKILSLPGTFAPLIR